MRDHTTIGLEMWKCIGNIGCLANTIFSQNSHIKIDRWQTTVRVKGVFENRKKRMVSGSNKGDISVCGVTESKLQKGPS